MLDLNNSLNKKTVSTLGLSAAIFILGLAAAASVEIKSLACHSIAPLIPQEMLDLYRSGLPFKRYISLTIKNKCRAQARVRDSNVGVAEKEQT